MEGTATGSADLLNLPLDQLFDSATDPDETTNLQAECPDRFEEMQGLLSQIIENGRSTPGPKLKNDAEIVMIKPITQPKPKKN